MKHALRTIGEDVLIDTKQTKLEFPVATFKTDLKSMARHILQKDQVPRFTKDAVSGMMTFINNYMLRYLRSAVGLIAHSGIKTLRARDLKNACRVCADLPTNIHTEGAPPAEEKEEEEEEEEGSC